METKSGNRLPETSTEDWYCQRHALSYSEAYDKARITAPPNTFAMYPIQEEFDSWDDLWRFYNTRPSTTTPCHTCHIAHVDYLWHQRNVVLQRLEQATAKTEAQQKLRAQLGPREFTFTYSPSWFETDEDAQRAMESAIEKLTRYYKDEIIEFHAIGEFTRDGRSHVHAWYNLIGGRKITDKNFKRAYPHWNPKRKLGKGFEGGHHATIQRISDFHGYTEKHLDEAWLSIHIPNGPHQTENSDPQRTREEADA